ncbi:MAG: hypothetical protein HY341_02635 [Candidatus Kerfeldbacteria bacterium]|nr:hypothetical protein [Candidatus Kerfeldbacteria bacterium]
MEHHLPHRPRNALIIVCASLFAAVGIGARLVWSQAGPQWSTPTAPPPDPNQSSSVVNIGPGAQQKIGAFGSNGLETVGALDAAPTEALRVESGDLSVTDAGGANAGELTVSDDLSVHTNTLQVDRNAGKVGVNVSLTGSGFCTVGPDDAFDDATVPYQACTSDAQCGGNDTCFLTKDFSVQGNASGIDGGAGDGVVASQLGGDADGIHAESRSASGPGVEGVSETTAPGNGPTSIPAGVYGGFSAGSQPADDRETYAVYGEAGGGPGEQWSGYFVGTSAIDTDDVDNTMRSAASLSADRIHHTATLLADNRVLIAGGATDTGTVLSSADLFSWDGNGQGSVAAASAMPGARRNHTATLLDDGTVLIVGGNDGLDRPAGTFRFDPTSGGWIGSGNIATVRERHTATLLDDGTVLIVGGMMNVSGATTSAVELYEPGIGFRTLTSMNQTRSRHTATKLADGRVLVVGGFSDDDDPSTARASAEVYDPDTERFTVLGSTLSTARGDHAAALRKDNNVFITGGENDSGILDSTSIFNPGTLVFSNGPAMQATRAAHTMDVLSDGRILLAGGGGSGGSGGSSTAAITFYRVHSATDTEFPWLFANDPDLAGLTIDEFQTSNEGEVGGVTGQFIASLATHNVAIITDGTLDNTYIPTLQTWVSNGGVLLFTKDIAEAMGAGSPNFTFAGVVTCYNCAESSGWDETSTARANEPVFNLNVALPDRFDDPLVQARSVKSAGAPPSFLGIAEYDDQPPGLWDIARWNYGSGTVFFIADSQVAAADHPAGGCAGCVRDLNGSVAAFIDLLGDVVMRLAGSPSTDTAELYTPSSDTFATIANTMSAARMGHASVRLPDDLVLVSGGSGDSTTDLYRYGVAPFRIRTPTGQEKATMTVPSLDVQYLDGRPLSAFLQQSDTAGQFVELQAQTNAAAQNGAFAVDGGIIADDGIRGSSAAAGTPGVAITTSGGGTGLVGIGRNTTGAGDVTYGIYASAGSGPGTNLAAYLDAPVGVDGGTQQALSVERPSLAVNLNADLLDGLNASAFRSSSVISGYVQVRSVEGSATQTGYANLTGTVLASEGVTAARIVGRHTGAGVAAGYGVYAEVGSSGAPYAVYGEAGSGSGTEWAGYFRGRLGVDTGPLVLDGSSATTGGLRVRSSQMAGTGIIPNGANSVDIAHTRIEDDSRVFVTLTDPGTTTAPITFVVTKVPAQGKFTVSLFPSSVTAIGSVRFSYLVILEQ